MKQKMTTQQAIHILMHVDQYVEYDEDFGNMVKAPLMDACLMAIKALKKQDKNTWIPVTKELPDLWRDVLIHRTGGNFSIEFRCLSGGWNFDNDIMEEATHWMSLPEVPEEVSNV